MRARSQGVGQGKGAKRTKAREMAYLALRGTDLARVIAAGALHANLGGCLPGQALMFVDRDQLPQTLGIARKSRDYGVVALIEIARESLPRTVGEDQLLTDCSVQYIPLALVSRILFQSTSDREEFIARASGYGDVPAHILQYDVDSELFPLDALALSHDPGASAGAAVMLPVSGTSPSRTIDKLAGAVSAYLAAARGLAGGARMAADFEAACNGTAGKGSPHGLICSLALRLDPSPDNAVNASIIAVAAKALESLDPEAGFDADIFLASFSDKFEPGSEDERIARKFVDRAQSVLSGSAEVASDAFADYPGKTILRALLLFLLNPDASRLQSVGKRLGILGDSVRMLASALAGCMAGFAALAVPMKAPTRDCYLSLPLLAALVYDGHFMGFESRQSWSDDLSGEAKLCLQGYAIMTIVLPASPAIIPLRSTLLARGLAPMVDQGTGMLVWSEPLLKGIEAQARPCMVPIFPERDGVEILVRLPGKSPRRDVLASVTGANARSRQSRVFASGVERGRYIDLELYVFGDFVEEEVLARALRAIAAEIDLCAFAS